MHSALVHIHSYVGLALQYSHTVICHGISGYDINFYLIMQSQKPAADVCTMGSLYSCGNLQRMCNLLKLSSKPGNEV